MKFHHIGIATENIENTIIKLRKYMNVNNISEIIYDEKQDANICMLTLEDGTQLELVSGKVVENILKRKNYLYHTCFITKSFNETINKFIDNGAVMVSEPKTAKLFNNRLVAFLMCDIGIVEILEGGE